MKETQDMTAGKCLHKRSRVVKIGNVTWCGYCGALWKKWTENRFWRSPKMGRDWI